MPGRSKVWYVGVSVLYAVALGVMGGISIAGFFHFLKNGPWQDKGGLGTPAHILGTVVCALLISGCQIGRIFRSMERTRVRQNAIAESSGTTLHGYGLTERACEPRFWLGYPGLALLLIFGPALSGWVIAFLREKL